MFCEYSECSLLGKAMFCDYLYLVSVAFWVGCVL